MIKNCLNFFRPSSWDKRVSIGIYGGNRDSPAERKTEIILIRESQGKPVHLEAAHEEVCFKRWGHIQEAGIDV